MPHNRDRWFFSVVTDLKGAWVRPCLRCYYVFVSMGLGWKWNKVKLPAITETADL